MDVMILNNKKSETKVADPPAPKLITRYPPPTKPSTKKPRNLVKREKKENRSAWQVALLQGRRLLSSGIEWGHQLCGIILYVVHVRHG